MLRVFLFLLLSLTCALGNGRKGPKAHVSFHIQDSGGFEGKKVFKQMTAGETVQYRAVPVISTKDVVAFSPFPADDGSTYGLVLQLSKTGTNRLTSISTAHQGSWLLAQANGRVVDAVMIDQPVHDGKIVIWKNITLGEIKLIDHLIPRIGEDAKTWKKRLKEIRKKQK